MTAGRFAARLRDLARLEMSDAEAEELWRNVARHRRALWNRLGRDVGARVALLDYIVNIGPSSGSEPQIIPRRSLEYIEQRAVTDALTGLGNRSVFDFELEREVSRCLRYDLPVSLILLDLDHFKDVNDRHGHDAGDEVLRQVGAILQRHVRTVDVACRYGGDEFAVILPETPLETASAAASRMASEIAAHFEMNPVNGRYLDVGASVGVADRGAAQTAADLLKAADAALYSAKRSGGNAFPTLPISGAYL